MLHVLSVVVAHYIVAKSLYCTRLIMFIITIIVITVVVVIAIVVAVVFVVHYCFIFEQTSSYSPADKLPLLKLQTLTMFTVFGQKR